MKTDRLLAITLYLLNREVVSASALAVRFEVSKRTIQRDIEILNQAGIPIVSAYGVNGGYEIMDGFKLIKQVAGVDDYLNIITALKGLHTAADLDRVDSTLEKISSFTKDKNTHIFMDLSAYKEGAGMNEKLKKIDRAITDKAPLRLTYLDASSKEFERMVEPLALSYQWHAWYLFAYCLTKKDYRLFKLPRILSCEPLPGGFTMVHGNVEKLLEDKLHSDSREYSHVRLLCRKAALYQAQEYFPNADVEKLENGDAVLSFHVPFERMWFSLLMGFGDQIQVLEPEDLKHQLKEKAGEIVALYS